MQPPTPQPLQDPSEEGREALQSRRHTLDSEALARRLADATLERKALDVVVIDVRGRSSYTDFLIIASGTSDRHVQSIAELTDETMRSEQVRSIGSEGLREGAWALLDYGSVVVHVFHQFTRSVYNLEALWKEAPRIELNQTAANARR